MVFAKIIGTGSYLPKNVVTNDDLAERLAKLGVETSDEWIYTRTGIKQRYIAEEGELSSDLASAAARNALERANISPQEIDLVVVATTTPDNTFPSTACMVQSKLGIKGPAFDVQAVCSGFVYALSVANNAIRCGEAKCVLVIGAEVFSRILDWSDRRTCVLFGDGSGAVVLKASEEAGIIATDLGADGSLNGILHTTGHIANGQIEGNPYVQMDGQAVFKQAVTNLEKSAVKVFEKAGLPFDALDWLVPHQANIRIMQSLGKKLGLDESHIVVTVSRHANTSAASVPLALDTAVRAGDIKEGQLLLLQGVGGGFTWGSVLVRM
ncbi:beta-ketoacyl-ACP synthase III [Basilea psittacipulmonis]|uniref:Beta-ketoacyl-[acyl-carrier-protein] synthase III n=2 Tax=Basilea TaxID=1472344 RepID=A0A077DGI8_9BURK|nr:beta-ketoacyl-ACP synthase III [Basilea psittacipulmonis]AIL33251.1 3-oxoacyl-ACP synthase [Basilea psittacipulmonis DSM 24701]